MPAIQSRLEESLCSWLRLPRWRTIFQHCARPRSIPWWHCVTSEENMETLMQDVRYGWRVLTKSPTFTMIAVLTLALGIGASTAVFSVVDTVLLHPLPYKNPEQLVVVSETLPQMLSEDSGVSAGEFQDYRDRNRSFSQVAAYESAGFNLTGDGEPL